MTPNPRVVQVFRMMKEIGISEEKVELVLKKLLKLYDKDWELDMPAPDIVGSTCVFVVGVLNGCLCVLHNRHLMHDDFWMITEYGGGTAFRAIHSFPRHDIIKLQKSTFVQWKHQVSLIVYGYRLTDFITDTVVTPPPVVPDKEGKLVLNPDFATHHQQDKLLAS
ncbi:hypothetical protein Gogos_022069 [Gossypium gossypioides]|uniref:WIYLD domain-containing protein n=1 Tax=Gossypium gossypioides TaxID=34282 RepID=A0A7J9D4Q7_GOSGO|nr:hypothetical protein [Gossypium gossypioides]